MPARSTLLLVAALLAGCNSLSTSHDSWLSDVHAGNGGSSPRQYAGSRQAALFGGAAGAPTAAFSDLGTGDFTAAAVSVREAPTFSGEPGVTLNLVNVRIDQAAKTVLGDLLGLNFTVDERVQGAITLQTTNPISKAALVDVFETVLRSRGGAIVEEAGFYRILPLEDARVRDSGAGEGNTMRRGPGLAVQVLSMAYVSAEEMRGILEPIAPAGGILRVDAKRNLIVVAGTASELASMRETVALFDVDWMKGMSFALHPLRSSEPAAVAAELDTIFDTKDGPLKQMVRFVPNKRLNAVLVVASRPHYLAEAASWVARLDRVGSSREDRLIVYEVHNRKASEVAPLLQSVFRQTRGGPLGSEGSVAPALEPVEVISEPGDLIAGAGIDEPSIDAMPMAGADSPSIVADDTENSLVIYASSADHERIAAILGHLDRLPTQVLLEATIAEVTLGDELQFGLRWFFESGNFSATLTDAANGGISATLPGFSYLFSTGDVQVVLNALSSVTDVKIVSSPTLMVLDNREATLQVGDQVPIVTQTAQSTTDRDAPIINSVELKDTGVILAVRPHVNESGRVVLEIQQEVSSVVATTTSGIDSPTIRQRKLSTTVVVGDGESLALGGLIQERNSQTRSKVPLLGDVPLIGSAFRHKKDEYERTELIVFIRPRIVHDVEEARMITDEYRSQLILQSPAARNPGETIRRDAARALN